MDLEIVRKALEILRRAGVMENPSKAFRTEKTKPIGPLLPPQVKIEFASKAVHSAVAILAQELNLPSIEEGIEAQPDATEEETVQRFAKELTELINVAEEWLDEG